MALRGVPQHVTRRGKPAVVVLSEDDFAVLQRSARAQAPGFVEHLLAMPKVRGKKEGYRARAALPILPYKPDRPVAQVGRAHLAINLIAF